MNHLNASCMYKIGQIWLSSAGHRIMKRMRLLIATSADHSWTGHSVGWINCNFMEHTKILNVISKGKVL